MADEHIRALARAFLVRSFAVLQRQHVIPAPVFHPHVQVGRDFYGPDLMGAEYEALTSALDEAYPWRFGDPLKRNHAEFSSVYAFGLVEAAIALCTRNGDYSIDSGGCAESLDELRAVLDADGYEAVCCRIVSHARVADGGVDVDGVLFLPADDEAARDRFIPQIRLHVPMVGIAFNREPPFAFGPPHAVLVARRRCANDEEPFAVFDSLSQRIDDVLLRLRLLQAPTLISQYQVTGVTTRVARVHPQLVHLDLGIHQSLVKRIATVDQLAADGVTALSGLLDEAPQREGYATSSWTVAVRKFNDSFRPTDVFTQAIDLATGLEAILTGEEEASEAIALRLSGRASALLASADEPATSVHRDVKLLYSLRSNLIHGGSLKEIKLRGIVNGVSTVTSADAFGIAMAEATDRFRDILRRCIVARLALAKAGQWAWRDAGAIEERLADDEERASWRSEWKGTVAALGAGAAARPASAPTSWLARDDT